MRTMNLFILFLLVLFSFGCDDAPSDAGDGIETLSMLPSNAVQEPYDSSDELVKVTLNINGEKNVGDYYQGKRSGNWTVFYSDGLVKSITSYVNGVKQGVYISLTNRGEQDVVAYYHNDKLEGYWKKFKRSTLKEERLYVNGKLEGEVKIYYDNGKLMEEGKYENGQREGVSKWFDQEGNVTIEYEYKKGKLQQE